MLLTNFASNTDPVLRSFNTDFDLQVINWVCTNHALLASLFFHYIYGVFHCMYFPRVLLSFLGLSSKIPFSPSYFLNIGLGHRVLYMRMNFQDFMEPIVR